MRFKSALFVSGLLCGAVSIAVSTLAFVLDQFHELPHGDMWDFVHDVSALERGEYPVSELWRQHNEHRLLFPRLLYFADFLWFQGRGVFLNTVSFAIQFGHGCVVAALLLRGAVADRFLRWAGVAVVLASLFGSLQINNFLWSFQVQFFLVHAGVVAALFFASRSWDRESESVRWGALWGAVIAAFVATFSMVSGVLVWPILLLLVLHLRVGRTVVRTVLASGAATLLFYFWEFATSPSSGSLMSKLDDLGAVGRAFLSLVGSPAKPLGLEVTRVAGTGVLGALLLGFCFFPWRRSRSAAESVLVFGMLQLLGVLMMIALGRAHFGVENIVISRYGTVGLLLWGYAACWLVLRGALVGSVLGRAVSCAAATLWVGYLLWAQPAELDGFRSRYEAQSLAGMSALSGVEDPVALYGTHPVEVERTAKRVAFLRPRQLSVFRHGWQFLIGDSALKRFGVRPKFMSHGGVDCVLPVVGDPTARRVVGWSYDARTQRTFRRILLVDETGQILGLASGGVRCPRAQFEDPAVPLRAGFQGYIRVPEGVNEPFRIFAVAVEPGGVHATGMKKSQRSVPLDFAAPESLGAPVADVAVRTSSGWSIASGFVSQPKSPGRAATYGSHGGDDAHRGELELGPFVLPAGSAIGIPIMSGPNPRGAQVEIRDAQSGTVLAEWADPSLRPHSWRVWRFECGDEERQVRVVARDCGEDYGAWFAVSLPSWIRPSDSVSAPREARGRR